jgi:hypothetical protein
MIRNGIKYFEHATDVCTKMMCTKISSPTNTLLSKNLSEQRVWDSIFKSFKKIKEESFKKENRDPSLSSYASIAFPGVPPYQWVLYIGDIDVNTPEEYIAIKNNLGTLTLRRLSSDVNTKVDITLSDETSKLISTNNFLGQYPSLCYDLTEVVNGLKELDYNVCSLNSDLKCLDDNIYKYSNGLLLVGDYFSE